MVLKIRDKGHLVFFESQKQLANWRNKIQFSTFSDNSIFS